MNKPLPFLLVVCAIVSAARAEDGQDARYAAAELARLPVKGTPLFDGANLKAFSAGGSHEIVAAEGQPFGSAIRVNVPAAGKQAWDVQLFSPKNTVPIRKGDVLLLILNVRCLSSGDPSATGTYAAYLQRTNPPWTAPVSISATATRQWQRVYAAGIADRDFPAGDLSLAVHLAQHAQQLEFGGVMVVNLGKGVELSKLPYTPRTYGGREDDAPWRKAAAERIERCRKGDLSVIVVDAGGKPVAGAEVHVRMKRHAFGFGSFIESSILDTTPDAQKYREWTLKPNGQAYMDLVFKQWWTDVKGKTAADGTCAARGFCGDYLITVTSGGRSITTMAKLPATGRRLTIKVE